MVKKQNDYPLILSVFILIFIGIVGIYCADNEVSTIPLAIKQMIWAISGTFLIIFIQFIHPKKLLDFAPFFYTLMIISFVLVIFIGSTHMGAKRWLNLGFYEIQPSEFGKLIIVLALARYFSLGKVHWNKVDITNIIGVVITLVPVFLVFKQPDLGTSLVYLAVLMVMMFASGLSYLHTINILMMVVSVITKALGYQFFITQLVLYGIFLVKTGKKKLNILILWLINFSAGMATSFMWDKLKPYQKQRITSFLDPEKFVQQGGWHVVQSKTAIVNGGFWGQGIKGGSQTQLNFLPEGHTDFIFAVIIEELGMFMGIIVIALFALLIYRTVKISISVKNKGYFLICIGIASIFLYQVMINIGMTMGIMPITGLPLPFLSYGGSSMLFNMALVGILINISRNRRDF
ncbi:MAG: rod shape-determining protein RodA [Candidatus Delongbacteria bacterium]|nr:rod shape-determining protein RodA [Candidatus Delongbacteria bacterium]MBN2836357.1 rod shape-determining protein RodA [Candidatus Delongbacteria bacterium]